MSSDSPSQEGSMAVTDVLDLLADARRRHALAVLAEEDGTIDDTTLIRRVSEAERADDVDPRDVHIELHHCHLPKLDDYGVLEYDYEEGAVGRGPTFDETVSHLERVNGLSTVESVTD